MTYLRSSLSLLSSCSICKKTCTISAIMMGHNEVTWSGDMRSNITRKHKKTAACTDGPRGTRRKLLANCSAGN